MARLAHADVRLMLDFLYTAGEVDGPDPFPEPVVDALRRLIPADGGAALVEVDGRDPVKKDDELTLLSFARLGSTWCYNVGEPWTAELDEICRQYVERDDPIPPRPAFLNRALRFSDLLSTREYHARALYVAIEGPSVVRTRSGSGSRRRARRSSAAWISRLGGAGVSATETSWCSRCSRPTCASSTGAPPRAGRRAATGTG